MIFLNILVIGGIFSKPLEGDNDWENSSNANGSDEQDSNVPLVTTPSSRKIIDVNNIDAQFRQYLKENNLNPEQLKQLQEQCRQQNCRNPAQSSNIQSDQDDGRWERAQQIRQSQKK